jgi:hypothetical protein
MISQLKTFVIAGAMVAMSALSVSAATIISATVSTGYNPAYGVDNAGVWLDAPAIVDGSASGQYRSPFDELGSTGNDYYTVGSPAPNLAPSPAVLEVDATNTFTMLWGSIDTYNSVLFSNGTDTLLVTGSDIIAALNGGVMGTTNAIVDFTLDFAFTTVSFFSNNGVANGKDIPAFEFALAAVPVPAAGLLLLTAVGAAAALRRRKAVTAA